MAQQLWHSVVSEEFTLPFRDVPWLIAITAIIGWWTDRHASRRIPFLSALVVLTGSTVMMWLTRPIWCQVVSRVLQGLASTMIYVTGLAMIVDTVGTAKIAEYMGHMAIALNLGSFAGPLLGGVVYEAAGYDAVWGMMIAFVGLDILLRFAVLEPAQAGHGTAVLTAPSGTVAIGCPDRTSTSSADHDDVKNACAQEDSASSINVLEKSFAATVNVTTKSQRQMPAILRLLCSIRMDVALTGIGVQALVFSGFETVLSIYVQEIWGYNAMSAGLFFLPLTISSFLAPLIGRVVDRVGTRWTLVGGFLFLCPVLVLVRFVDHNTLSQKVLLAALLFLIGLGITATLDPLMAEVTLVVEEEEKRAPENFKKGAGAYGQAYCLFCMAWSVGNIVGPIAAGLIRDRAGWATMGWSLGAMAGVAAVPCAIWSGSRRTKPLDHRDSV